MPFFFHSGKTARLLAGALGGALAVGAGLRLFTSTRGAPATLAALSLGALLGALIVGCTTSTAAELPASGSRPAAISAADGMLGAPLAEAQKTDFFTFFHLEQTDSAKDAGGQTVLTFKPSGPAFRALVTVKVAIDGAKRVTGIELLMRRDFVDSPTNSVFARDIAKSLLRSALSAAGQGSAAELINEIEYRRGPSTGTLIVGPGYKAPSLPAQPSAGYQTYLGQGPLYEQTLLSRRRLRLENTEAEGARALLISVR